MVSIASVKILNLEQPSTEGPQSISSPLGWGAAGESSHLASVRTPDPSLWPISELGDSQVDSNCPPLKVGAGVWRSEAGVYVAPLHKPSRPEKIEQTPCS